ncbi:hypothetical protein [Streptomyces sp. NPDC001380]|uniref:hypothetical protein n=1 Tax=Streptomyces sp. NPDC001380 TaxID=3364566 RepID=UPI00369774B6
MSDAVSAYDFTTARRGYAPEQVARAVTALVTQRDEAWERLSVLGARIREMEAELAAAVQAAEEAPPPDFSQLSARAAGLLSGAGAEAETVVQEAERAAAQLHRLAVQEAQRQSGHAAEAAGAARAGADADAEQLLEQARAAAAKLREEAAQESAELLAAAERDAAAVRGRAEQEAERSRSELAARQKAADEEAAASLAREEELEERINAVAERRDQESARHRQSVLARVSEIDEEARVRAERILDRARQEAERITAASEREQRTYEERQELVQVHLDHIRQTLSALTNMPTAAGAGTAAFSVPAPAAEALPVAAAAVRPVRSVGAVDGVPHDPAHDPDSDTAEIPLPAAPPPPAQRTGSTGEERRAG